MKKCCISLLFVMVGIITADQISGTLNGCQSFDVVVLSPDVCGETVYKIFIPFISPCPNFNLTPPSGCSFCYDTHYYLTAARDDGDTIHEPGEPLSLYGPFNVDASCNHTGVSLTMITRGGFAGYICNASKLVSLATVDSIKIKLYHLYKPKDSSGYDTTVSLQNLVNLGGGTYHYQITNIRSGGKAVEFFKDLNMNGLLDTGEPSTVFSESIAIAGNHYDSLVNLDLTVLNVQEEVKPTEMSVFYANPNPFNASIEFHLDDCGNILLYDLFGRIVNKISVCPDGIWDGKDFLGKQMPSGMYLAVPQTLPDKRLKIWLLR